MGKSLKNRASTTKQTVVQPDPRAPFDLENSVSNCLKLDKPNSGELVGRILVTRYLCGDATLRNVARDLGIHPRALSRRLLREHTNFRDLRSRARFQLATQFLTHTSLKVNDIAEALGYAETSTFTRAFRTWAGKSPNVWRKLFRQRSGVATQQNCGSASALTKVRVGKTASVVMCSK
jgi:AraC-like DNA-binding protein